MAVLSLAAVLETVRAQAPGVPIEKPVPVEQDPALLDSLAALRDSGRGLTATAARQALLTPTPETISLPPCRTTPLRPAEVWEAAQRSRLWIGWHFLCHKCDHWHVNLAGGYPLTADGIVATCHHVVEPGPEIREGRLVAVDGEGRAWPVTAVLAANREMDACLVRVDGWNGPPLPLNDQVRPGDPAFLLSSPLGVSGYFSSGLVNRFFWSPKLGTSAPAADDFTHLRMNVSTDWAPGSSGAPVLDTCGNAIGHVATISHLGDAKNSAGKGVAHLTLHEGVPARSLISLVRQCHEAAARPPQPAASFAALQEAIGAREFAAATTLANALENESTDPPARLRLLHARFAIAVGTGNEDEAAACTPLLVDASPTDAASSLNDIAWKLVTTFPSPKPETLAAAERAARRSVELHQHRDPASLDTLARVCFLQSNKDEAIRLQEMAVALAEGPLRPQLEGVLASYRTGTLPDVQPE